ncbi:MAG: GIY-YIG nuclease family protein [Desulfobacteraceae bacterium]
MHIPLKSLKILALDCQTTGNSLKYNDLLEIGWLEFSAIDPLTPQGPLPVTFVVRQPRQPPLSKRIQKLTGIGDNNLKSATDAKAVLDHLLLKASEVARANRAALCPVAIHYANFEMGFLNKLNRQSHHGHSLPFNVICTHQIACKLMPQLPRKGIRAVAGYLGHSIPTAKRCAHHLVATAHIWRHLVELLADRHSVHTMDQLQRWLKYAPLPAKTRAYPMPRDRRLGLPDSPGIYRMLRSNGDVLYIGKATSLRKRINSYFHKRRHPEAILEMLTQAVELEIAQTGSALEAALRESDAIKRRNPPYNTALVSRHRKVSFISRDFASHSPIMNQTHPLGPVPSVEPFSAANALGKFMGQNGNTSYDISRIMAISDDAGPDASTFQSGVALFQEKYCLVLGRMAIGPALLHIGRLSWKEKLTRQEIEASIDSESETIEGATVWEWNPQAVVGRLESICRRCAFMLRRARWFAVLSESTVAWQAGGNERKDLNIVVMHKGNILRNDTSRGSTIPIPPGSATGHAKRRARIDLARYDRLRVLTTEIRRLITEDRLICLRLSERVYLRSPQFRLLFNWI